MNPRRRNMSDFAGPDICFVIDSSWKNKIPPKWSVAVPVAYLTLILMGEVLTHPATLTIMMKTILPTCCLFIALPKRKVTSDSPKILLEHYSRKEHPAVFYFESNEPFPSQWKWNTFRKEGHTSFVLFNRIRFFWRLLYIGRRTAQRLPGMTSQKIWTQEQRLAIQK